MRARPRALLLCWLGMLLLLGAEFGGNYLPLSRGSRPLLLLPAVAMAAIVALGFMNLGRGPATARIFAIAGIFWLIVLLCLGSVDPLTRTLFLVQHSAVP